MSDEIKCECEECSNLELPEEGVSFVLYEKYEKLKQELERVKGERDEAVEVAKLMYYGWVKGDSIVSPMGKARQFLAKLNKEKKDE